MGVAIFLPAWRCSLRVERGEVLPGYKMISKSWITSNSEYVASTRVILFPSLDFSEFSLKIESRGRVFARGHANCWVLVFHRHV